jgi:hypothetical protein
MIEYATIIHMPAPKGRPQQEKKGECALYAQVAPDVVARLNAGAAALNISRGAYIDRLVRLMPVDDRSLPPWLAEMADAEQLPLLRRGEEPERAAA